MDPEGLFNHDATKTPHSAPTGKFIRQRISETLRPLCQDGNKGGIIIAKPQPVEARFSARKVFSQNPFHKASSKLFVTIDGMHFREQFWLEIGHQVDQFHKINARERND